MGKIVRAWSKKKGKMKKKIKSRIRGAVKLPSHRYSKHEKVPKGGGDTPVFIKRGQLTAAKTRDLSEGRGMGKGRAKKGVNEREEKPKRTRSGRGRSK